MHPSKQVEFTMCLDVPAHRNDGISDVILGMGVAFSDKYSFLHFATGIVVYYWGMSFLTWFIVHGLFEIFENTETAMKYINRITLWPGGKDSADSYMNRIGDQIYAMVGWISAYIISGKAIP